jgi:hypothetical protein
MADPLTDWRLFGTHHHLKGVTLWWRAYAPRNEIWAQDHCQFCWATFARSGENVWHEGYATQPPYGVSVAEPGSHPAATESAATESVEQDEYVSEVIAAVKATAASDDEAEPDETTEAETMPEGDEDLVPDVALPAPDAALEAAVLDALSLPATSVKPPKVEAVTWICPQCFDDFQDQFGWVVANAE